MQNSPGIPVAALIVAIALATITILSLMAGVGGDPALNELQIKCASDVARVLAGEKPVYPVKA